MVCVDTSTDALQDLNKDSALDPLQERIIVIFLP